MKPYPDSGTGTPYMLYRSHEGADMREGEQNE